MFLSMLTKDEICNISNLKLLPGPKLHRSIDRDLSINFFYKTKIEKEADTSVIPDENGMVTSYGHLKKKSNGAGKLDVVLTNIRMKKWWSTYGRTGHTSSWAHW